jgi:hypothetical protein
VLEEHISLRDGGKMNKRVLFSLFGLFVLFALIVFISLRENQSTHIIGNEFQVTVFLDAPDCYDTPYGVPCGSALFGCRTDAGVDPKNLLREILGGYSGYEGQYYIWSLLENFTENDEEFYRYDLWDTPENFPEYNAPPIRQDNENVNFCFYVRVRNIVIGNKPWWDYALGCGSLDFTLILPENYGLREDVMSALRYGKLGYRDNQYSIFTSASSLEKMFADNRWRITARWEEGKFDRFNADLYLEVHYRKTSH